MRPRCKCGNIAGYWYSPMVYVRMRVDQYLNAHCCCASCADVDNWGEYEYVGFHKKDWRWLKLKGVEYNVNVRDAWMDKPFYLVSYIKEGKKWHYGIVRDKGELKELGKTLEGMEWKEKRYPDIREEQLIQKVDIDVLKANGSNKDKAMMFKEAGWKYQQIADHLGVSVRTVNRWLN